MADYMLGNKAAYTGQLAQSNPGAASDTTLYTCGSQHGAIGLTVTLTNTSTATTYRIWIRKQAEGTATKQYKGGYDTPLAANAVAKEDIAGLDKGDLVMVRCASANVAVTLEGTELR